MPVQKRRRLVLAAGALLMMITTGCGAGTSGSEAPEHSAPAAAIILPDDCAGFTETMRSLVPGVAITLDEEPSSFAARGYGCRWTGLLETDDPEADRVTPVLLQVFTSQANSGGEIVPPKPEEADPTIPLRYLEHPVVDRLGGVVEILESDSMGLYGTTVYLPGLVSRITVEGAGHDRFLGEEAVEFLVERFEH